MASILIIEDDTSLRKMLRFMLEKAGYEIREAANGNLGIQAFRENPADLVIVDIFMPEKDGLDTFNVIQNEYPKVKVIVMSGGGKKGIQDYLKYARVFGAHHCLTKPFDNTELLSAVRELLIDKP